jgi:hypothetical protein
MKALLKSLQLVQEKAVLIRTRVISILVNQNEGNVKKNLKFQNAVPLQLMDTKR